MKTSRKPSSSRVERSQRSLQGQQALPVTHLPERSFRIAAWDKTGPDGQVTPFLAVARRLTKNERRQAYYASRQSEELMVATCAQLSLRAPIADPADPNDPAKMRGGAPLFKPYEIPALLAEVDHLRELAFFAMGLEAQGDDAL